MSSNKPSPDTSNQSWFNKFIALLTALGGGAGIVALLVYFLGSHNTPELGHIPDKLNESGSIFSPNKNGREVEFCSSNFPNQYGVGA